VGRELIDLAVDHREPRHQRRLALIVLLAAAALAVAAFPFRAKWWGGWILAIAEAGVVGGLADWFAVTALFRHPLGIPIPHTALIPANWQLMAARVGGMVGGRILTTEYVTREISRVDVATLLAQIAGRVKPADIEPLVATVARWAAAQIPPGSATELVSWIRRLLLTHPIAPMLADIADVAHRNGWDQRLVEALARTLVETLDRPDVRNAVGELVDEVVGSYRRRMSGYPGLLIRIANVLGLIDRDRLVSALRAALAKVADDPNDPLRRRIAEALAELPGRLRTEPALAARVEATKTELLTSSALSGLVEDAAAGLSRALVTDLASHRSELVAWITGQIERARETLVSDAAVRTSLDHWLKQHAATIVERYQNHLAAFVERGVHALGAEGAVRLIEEHAGDDLQYIRVNGTVVGGLAGGGIYGLHLLLNFL
jgi:uncharacterized membrane-anchored protein YjiN (DUF445 family)